MLRIHALRTRLRLLNCFAVGGIASFLIAVGGIGLYFILQHKPIEKLQYSGIFAAFELIADFIELEINFNAV